MMLKLQMLPAGPGDCLWLEYGTPPDTRVVIIDGGLGKTAKVLRARIEEACRERRLAKLEVELLVVTHIDNDHIVGIIKLLKNPPDFLHVKEVWFNGLPQLKRLPTPSSLDDNEPEETRSQLPADVLGGNEFDDHADDDESLGDIKTLASPADLLGRPQSDELSQLLASSGMPWNASWNGEAVMIPATGDLPTRELDGNLKLTILGPTLTRLYKLCTAWRDVLGGAEDSPEGQTTPDDLLGPSDTWPPVWIDGEKRDSSFANGSSIMLLAEYPGNEQQHHALLLAGDAHAPDIDAALKRLLRERRMSSTSFPLDAFKLAHHGSAHNLTREVLETVDCSRYLISTDGSGRPRHPDHQALLRILRYSRRPPHLMFNYRGKTTSPWLDSKADVVVDGEFQDFAVSYPAKSEDGLILDL
jgi:beta-lactamase superfamily II metal-dependent hydrolase